MSDEVQDRSLNNSVVQGGRFGRGGGRFHKCQYYGCGLNLKISDGLPCLSEGCVMM